MTDEQWQTLVKFIRAYTRLRIDSEILSAMLFRSQIDEKPPEDWFGDLKKMRELPVHKAAIEEIESLLVEVEKDRRENELLQILRDLPADSSIN